MKIQNINIETGDEMNSPDRLAFFDIFNTDDEQKKEMSSFIQVSETLDTFIDVGCSYGSFSFVFSSINKTGKSYAFDGSSKAINAVRQTTLLNPHLKVFPNNILVGNLDGMVPCMFDTHQSLVGGNVPNMPITKIDTFCQQQNIRYDIMKIDVEGYEYNVLLGAEETIAQFRPILFMEVHPFFMRDFHQHSIEHIMDFFRRHNYTAYGSDLNRIDDYYEHLKKETTHSNRTIWSKE